MATMSEDNPSFKFDSKGRREMGSRTLVLMVGKCLRTEKDQSERGCEYEMEKDK